MKNLILTALLFTVQFAHADLSSEPEILQANKTDALLNATYQQILYKLHDEPKAQSALKKNQREWLKYSLSYCSLGEAIGLNGKDHRFTSAICFSNFSKERINHLNNLKCSEGDMASSCLIFEH